MGGGRGCRPDARWARRPARRVAPVVVALFMLTACTSGSPGATHARASKGIDATSATGSSSGPSGQSSRSSRSSAASRGHPALSRVPVFAIYYMWWDRQHWLSHLGRRYPATAAAAPLPATLDRSGCGAVSRYPGNVETDVSRGLAYDQSKPQTITRDVRLAAQAGLAGFVVNWVGTGQPAQTPRSSSYDTRLQWMFDAVHALNAAGTRFTLILNYQSSAKRRSTTQFARDFGYFLSRYGRDPALDHRYSTRPEVVMAGTWKYTDGEITAISRQFRSHLYLIGDEKPSSWDATRAQYLDGTSYYWSSQNPVKNPRSFATLQHFAATVRATRNPDGRPKTWLAPFSPGYNASLLYHTPTCVPRDNGRTMTTLFAGNTASDPDGWTLISWNEITEGTYVVPLVRYGPTYVDRLRALLANR